MNRSQLVTALSERIETTRREADEVLTSIVDLITATVAAGEDVAISGFAKFRRVDRPARMGRNPATGETIKIKAKRSAKITPLKQFKDAVLSLEVTPQITPDNRIILDLDVKKDTVGQVVVASGGVNVPSIDTQQITTQVLVSDGQTVVLGGILQTTHRVDETKVPYLGDVPILGNLFKTTTKTNDKDELLIFVTPKIVHEGVNVY